MDFPIDGRTWSGPVADDPELAAELPDALGALLSQHNGFILHGGALHVRGLVNEPWHSLRRAWRGTDALCRLYPTVRPSDVPFGEDCVGDQFLLRDGQVLRLEAETGEVYPIAPSLAEFFRAAAREPVDFLQAHALEQFREGGEELLPGQCLHADPPLCTVEAAADGVTLRAMSAGELLLVHAELAGVLAEVPDGGRGQVSVED
jgi:hypothetical protein